LIFNFSKAFQIFAFAPMKQIPLLLFAIVFSLPSTLASADLPKDVPVSIPGIDSLQVIFNQQPIEQGITFDRSGVKPTSVDIDGKSTEAWMADQSATPGMGWLRSFRFTVTDPLFKAGGRPAVDLEVTYYTPAPCSVRIRIDSRDGNKMVSDAWSPGKEWETRRVNVDDAYFGVRPDSSSEKPPLEGFDFRIDAANTPLYLKSVRLVGYDPKQNIMWSRMLKIIGLASGEKGGVLVFQNGPAKKISATLTNLAQIPMRTHYRLQMTGYDGKTRYTDEGNVTLQPASSLPLAFTFDTTGWSLGPYDGRLELSLDGQPGGALLSQTFRLGIISSAPLEKARLDEFLYGLDPANASIFSTHTPAAFAYYRLMGVDILRNPYDKGMTETVEDLGKALKDLAAENLQSMLMSDPPKELDPAKRDGHLKQKDAFLEEATRLYVGKGPGRIRYFELGNEPDLFGFYPGAIPDYTHDFYEMRESIKTGARKAAVSDSDTVVMNGGLSFAGTVGPARSEEFIKLLDPAKIDAIAYHGHGPDIHAERNAYERVYAVAKKYNKENHPFIETESGYSGHDHTGLEEQARTAVEKMIYGQSKGEPVFFFFRLFMEGEGTEGGYGMTDNFIEPHPAVLAYRNMVERLHHFTFSTTLDIAGKGGNSDVDGFIFEEKGAAGHLTGRKEGVFFAEKPIQLDLQLRLDGSGVPVTETAMYDMYGNPWALAVSTDNTVSIPVGLNPVFVAWKSSGNARQVEVVPPMLALTSAEPLLANADNKIEVSLHNTQHQLLEASVSLVPKTRLTIQAVTSLVNVTVPADQSAPASFVVTLGKAKQPLRLPYWWKAFTDVDLSKIQLEQISAIPETLPGAGAAIPGQFVWTPTNRLDFAKIAGSLEMKRPAIAFAYLDSPVDTQISCVADADWFMAWYVNGSKVLDTLEAGNGGATANHTFELPLKKGRNLIAVEVLSGKYGWVLSFGGPKERQIALTSGNDPDTVAISSQSDGKTLGTLIAPVRLQDVIPALDATASVDQLATWISMEPLTLLDDSSVKNLWLKEPDTSRWYKGRKDLSATVWVRDSGKALQLYIAVTDDVLVQATSPSQLAQADSIHVVLADDAGKSLLDLTGGLIGDKPVLSNSVVGVTFAASREVMADKDPQTLYRFEIPKSILDSKPFRLNLSISDNDSNFLKQTLELGDIAHPATGFRLITND